MSDARIKELVKRRGIVKGKVTNFSNYFYSLDTSKNLSHAQFIELKLRLEKIESSYDEYDQFQNDLDLLADRAEDGPADREAFDSQYYPLVADARAYIEKQQKRRQLLGEDNESSSGNSVHNITAGSSQAHSFVRLPKIDLPRFGGHYQHWLEFRDTFISLIHTNNNIDNVNKFNYLRASLQGSAALVIQSLDFKADNYSSAWKLLCTRYDNKRLLVHNHVQSLFNTEAIQRESSKAIRQLVDNTNKSLRALATLDQPTEHWDTLVIHLMTSKLDSTTHREWEEYRNTLNEPPTLEKFITFLSNRADLLETLEEAKHRSKPELTHQKSKSFIVSSGKFSSKLLCPICKQDHFIFGCESFKKLPVESRLQRAKDFKLCLNCLRPGHAEAKCRLGHCKYCKHKHNTLLHTESVAHDSVTLSARHISKNHNVLLSTALVRVLDNKGEFHSARILLDNGSTANFVTQDLCSRLGLHTVAVNLRVAGINNQVSDSSQACSLTFESYDGGYRTDIDCYILPTITSLSLHNTIQLDDIHIPNGIFLADPSFHSPSTIDILVGADVFWRVIGTNRIELGKNKPVIFETKLGWLVSGSVGLNVQHREHTNICMLTQESLKDADLTRFWELDTISHKHKSTPEENACEKHFSDSTQRSKDGRFIVNIPLKESPDVLGDSFQLAKRRFLSLERRLGRDPKLKQSYVEFINEYINLGHMSENLYDESTIKHNYLPHHGVLKETSTTTKLRVVFDASASTTSGKSFNGIQYVGPTVQDDLISILLRFRQYKYVVSADVEKMYRQILVCASQRPLQQILWRADPSHALKSYMLNTVTYGTASAPYLATRCLIQLGLESTNKDVKQAICHDFYVDDFLHSRESITATIALCQEIKLILDSAGFPLRKWHSNSLDILQAVSRDENSSNSVNLSENELSKTLGLFWKCNKDTLSFSINLTSNEKITKRHILSTIAQVFDPLGLVSPCIVEAKFIMQQLWISKCSWDEQVPQSIKTMWNNFAQSLPRLNNLDIPRHVACESPTNIQIHVFTDASERAYGACAYVRSTASDGSICVRLLASKSRVAPIKPTTIPRLELCGALLGSRLCSKIKGSLTLNYSECVFWSDSTIVLGWLATSPNDLQPFVRHRVCEIQDGFPGHKWRYVGTKANPADLVSRGLNANELNNSSLWWSGPSFLKLDPSKWPVNPNTSHAALPERVKSLYAVQSSDINPFSSLINNISSYSKLQRIVAYIFRFINNCKKVDTYKTSNLSLSSLELSNATNLLLSISQKESFPVEYQLLVSGKELPHKNRLLPLSPFIDSIKLIRVGGRLDNSHYDYNVKHPILLSSKHRLCELIFLMLHKKHLHSGPQLLLATARHNYWPLGGTNLAKRTVRSCIKCIRFKGTTIQPVMGNLPKQRLHLEYPFLDTGVDYAGPVMIASRKGRGCILIKSYICVFICLATKAVHLELVSDLTKEAYIAALNRFISRRGKPRTILSDNGSTFVGTFHELSKFLKQTQLSDLSDLGIKFSFIPAYTPHFGGLWESAVKSTKHHLRRVLELTHLNYEEMSTLLIQVEAILNSRPLTPLSQDPSDFYPLTPAHFLIGRSLLFVPHPQNTNAKITSLQRFHRIECLKQHFWNRFSKEYIHWLQQKTKWRRGHGQLKEGTLVVIKDKALPPLMWLLGRVVRLIPGRDGVSRVADIQTKKGVIRRAFNNICPLPVATLKTLQPGEDGRDTD